MQHIIKTRLYDKGIAVREIGLCGAKVYWPDLKLEESRKCKACERIFRKTEKSPAHVVQGVRKGT